MRKAHFSFGSKTPIPDLYTTTNRAVHVLNTNDIVKSFEAHHKIEKPITSVVYGNDPVVYTSITKDAMVEHNVKGQIVTQQQIK